MPSPLARSLRLLARVLTAPVRLGAHVTRVVADLPGERPRRHHPVLATSLGLLGLAVAALAHPMVANAGERRAPAAVVPALAPASEPRLVDLVADPAGPAGPADGGASTPATEVTRAAVDTTRSAVRAARDLTGRLVVMPHWGAETGWWGESRGARRHTGIDFDGDTGDEVVAAGAGRVIATGVLPDYGGYGWVVLIDHGPFQTLSAHLSAITVVPGQWVMPRQVIGAMGTTGNVTGSHLHFEVRVNGTPVDPHRYLPAA